MPNAVCSSCGRASYDYVQFTCPGPKCAEVKTRCAKCRDTENTFVCKSCGFTGP